MIVLDTIPAGVLGVDMFEYCLLHGDCLSLLGSCRPASIDMILADLPYGQTQNAWDTPLPFDAMWREFDRVAKPSAAVVLFAAQPFAAQLVCSNLKNFRYDLIWQKNKPTGFLNAKKAPLRNHEHLLVFYRSPPTYNPQMTNGHKPGNYARRTKHSTNYGAQTPTEYGGSTERYPLSVLPMSIINNDSPDKYHPTQKPVELLAWLVRSYTAPGAIVLDPTMGVGSTALACRQEGRHFVGVELNADYIEIAKRRLAQ